MVPWFKCLNMVPWYSDWNMIHNSSFAHTENVHSQWVILVNFVFISYIEADKLPECLINDHLQHTSIVQWVSLYSLASNSTCNKYFREKSFQAINCIGTDIKTTKKLIITTKRKYTKNTQKAGAKTNELALVETKQANTHRHTHTNLNVSLKLKELII